MKKLYNNAHLRACAINEIDRQLEVLADLNHYSLEDFKAMQELMGVLKMALKAEDAECEKAGE